MPIVRRKLDANTVYPTNIRYNEDTDTIQSLIGDDWVDNPAADPRTQTLFPPRLTSDPACDGAQSVVDALKGQISGVTEAIDNSKTLFTIAGIILSIFTFGTFGVFISLALAAADAMVGAGTTAINAALTDPVWHTLVCILMCNMTSEGRLNTGALATVISQVDDQIGGLGASIIDSMLSLAGEGGINNLASLGSSTGDCSDCGCNVWCYEYDFTLTDGGWTAVYGSWTGGTGWVGTAAGTAVAIAIDKTLDAFTVTHIEVDVTATGTCNVGITVDGSFTVYEIDVPTGTYSWDGEFGGTVMELNPSSGASQGANVTMTRILFRGTGPNPFGEDNCT